MCCDFVGMIPSSLQNCHNLTKLHLFANHLTGNIPMGFGQLTQLQELDLYDNTLNGKYNP